MNNRISVKLLEDKETYCIGSFEVKEILTLVFHHFDLDTQYTDYITYQEYRVFVEKDRFDKIPKFVVRKHKNDSNCYRHVNRKIYLYTAEYDDIRDGFSKEFKRELYNFLSMDMGYMGEEYKGFTVWNMMCKAWNKLNPDKEVKDYLHKKMPLYHIAIYSYFMGKELSEKDGKYMNIPITQIIDENTIVTNYTNEEDENDKW